ncbi:MAG TPA: saccharopine dehydrogenase C-terminal domain-containing protein [Actinomycetota bacterium]|nr:saccharopine dehydrogenase C-terminal domain-containing protein [Actinomycetota bacterium]
MTPSTHSYAILGAGRQGTAAAFDLVTFGGAGSVTLADADVAAAEKAASRVNELAGRDVADSTAVDASDESALRAFLEPADAAVSAVPYGLNLGVTRAAIAAGTHVCDLGGNTAIVRQQLDLDDAASAAGVCVVPDCGEAPGLATNLVAYAISLVDGATDVVLYDGGLPQRPVPPWSYELTFSVDGLTNEYDGATTWVREGRPVEVDCLDPAEYELVDLGEPYGTLEAFPGNTSSTMPWTLGLRSLRSMILRYPGHAAQFRAFRDLGLFEREPVDVRGVPVAPRDLYHALLDPRVRAPEGVRDVVLARVIVTAPGAEAVVGLEVLPDDHGFNAMERSTGGHAAIVARMMAGGRVRPGATPVELAVDPAEMVAEGRRRGFRITEEVRPRA